jgi:hypothetical protein
VGSSKETDLTDVVAVRGREGEEVMSEGSKED